MWMGKNLNTNDPNLNLDSNINLPKLFPITQLTQTNTNHHFLKSAAAAAAEENEQPVPAMGSSRWSPTPEQLLALEEMYRLGTRTPTAEQIQEIAVQLRRFGKIEGKNVFYWFQNHKARERQKRRRGVETNSKITRFDIENIEKKQLSAADKGLRRTVHEVEETNNLVPHSSCSVHTEGHVSMHRTARMAESRVHEWSQLEKRNLQQQKKKQEYTWQAARKFFSFQELHQEPTMTQMMKTNLVDEIKEIETLELFPLFREEEDDENGPKKDRKVPIQAINTAENLQFFEFLPLKN